MLSLYCVFADAGFEFDICYTSVLKRAIRTLWIVLDSIDQMWLPVHRTWRLNERHYGGLTGLNKAETAAKHGEAQVKIWRRSFDIPPPTMDADHDFYSIISKVGSSASFIHYGTLFKPLICCIQMHILDLFVIIISHFPFSESILDSQNKKRLISV